MENSKIAKQQKQHAVHGKPEMMENSKIAKQQKQHAVHGKPEMMEKQHAINGKLAMIAKQHDNPAMKQNSRISTNSIPKSFLAIYANSMVLKQHKQHCQQHVLKANTAP